MNSLATTRPLALSLTVDTVWPGWVVALVMMAIVGLIVWSYGPDVARSGKTMFLAGLRILAVMALFVLLLQPTLLLSRNLQPRSVLTIAIDTTASMGRTDGGPADETGKSPTRLDAAITHLTGDDGALLARLRKEYDLNLVAVGSGVASRMALTERGDLLTAITWLQLLKPDRQATDLTESIQQIIALAPPGEASAGLVLISDGRRTAGAPLTTTAGQLAALQAPAIAVPVGTDKPVPDLSLTDLEAAPRVFVGEPVAIRGRLEAAGIAQPVPATVQLVAMDDDHTIVEQTLTVAADAPAAEGQFSLIYRPQQPGLQRLEVRAQSTLQEPDLTNNRATISVEAVDAKIRVLYVDDRPRFEYRYLKNLLVREQTIVSACLLLGADPQFPQEGNEPIQRFPTTLKELDSYDVVILGDLDPASGWAGRGGLEDLARWVETKGGGLAWLPGSHNTLRVWQGTPLAKLLPVRLPPPAPATQPLAQLYHPSLTPQGTDSPIFMLDTTAASQTTAQSLINQLPPWYWTAIAGAATPAAQVLAVNPLIRTTEGAMPVIVTGRYGAGQTFYCGSDDIWRWRRFRDIEQWRSFWLQAIRWLAAPRKLGAYQPVALDVSPVRTLAGAPVTFTLQSRDIRLDSDLPERIPLTVQQTDSDSMQSLWLQRVAGQAIYTGSLSLARAGSYTAKVEVASATATASFTVRLPLAETADSPADPQALHRWIEAVRQGGQQGYTIEMDHLEELATLPLPHAPVRTQRTEIRLWDNWVALMIVTGLFLAEWVLRRRRGLA